MKFLILIIGLAGAASAQSIPFESRYRAGSLIPLRESPAFLGLKPANGGPAGKIFLRETPEGILLFGRVPGGPVNWKTAHVNVWLRATDHVQMPEIAWGNQFRFETCASPEVGLGSCEKWEAKQRRYRAGLESLFTREWQISSGAAREVFAARARDDLRPLESDGPLDRQILPNSAPQVHTAAPDYFEVLIRWNDFPPADSLRLRTIYLAADMDEGTRAAVPALARFTLERPHDSHITACRYDLSAGDQQRWYFPNVSGRVGESFDLENERQGYRYEPEGLSPVPVWTHYFEKPVGKGETVCGPALMYAVGARKFDLTSELVEEENLTIQGLPGGDYLLKSGPVISTLSPYGAGECGTCPVGRLAVFHLDRVGGIEEMFDESVMLGNQNEIDGDIQLSTDWKTITVYRGSGTDFDHPLWSYWRYCLADNEYNECGAGASDPPPEPRQVRLR